MENINAPSSTHRLTVVPPRFYEIALICPMPENKAKQNVRYEAMRPYNILLSGRISWLRVGRLPLA